MMWAGIASYIFVMVMVFCFLFYIIKVEKRRYTLVDCCVLVCLSVIWPASGVCLFIITLRDVAAGKHLE